MSDLVVIHDVGARGGHPWSEAFRHWPGTVTAPDLPGHGSADAIVGGHHEIGDAVYALVEFFPADAPHPPVVLGVGRNGFAAQVFALAGRAGALVLVDGLGGPWRTLDERSRSDRNARRLILDTPAMLRPHHGPGSDPRTAYLRPNENRAFALEVGRSMRLPTLVIETPASTTPDAPLIVNAYDNATLVTLETVDPERIAAATLDWFRATEIDGSVIGTDTDTGAGGEARPDAGETPGDTPE